VCVCVCVCVCEVGKVPTCSQTGTKPSGPILFPAPPSCAGYICAVPFLQIPFPLHGENPEPTNIHKVSSFSVLKLQRNSQRLKKIGDIIPLPHRHALEPENGIGSGEMEVEIWKAVAKD